MSKVVFAGSFDPFTLGHKDIAERASKLFGETIIAVARDNGKTSKSLEARLEIARLSTSEIKGVEVVAFDGLLTDFMRKVGSCVLIRGVRNPSDFEYERSLMAVYRSLFEGIEFVLLPSKAELSHISSTTVRELLRLGSLPPGYVDTKAEKIILDIYSE